MKSSRTHRPGGPGKSFASGGADRGSGQGRSGKPYPAQGQAGHGGPGGSRPGGATLSLRPREGGGRRDQETGAQDSRPAGGAARGQKPYAPKPQGGRPQGERGQGARANGPRPGTGEADFGYHGGPPRSQGGDAPRGTVWLYGQHAVAAALANPARRLRRLLLTEEAEAALAARLPRPWSVQPERMERGRIDHLLGREAVHQGAALLADPLAPPSLASALERPGPILVLDQVTDPRNVGAILRSAAAFGTACVITQDRNAPEETGALAKAASGALETMPLLRAVNIARTLIALKAAGAWVVGLDAAAGSPLSGPGLADRRVALVLGAEGEGMRRLTRETCDMTAMLTMPGAMESLNVSAAASVALYELARRA